MKDERRAGKELDASGGTNGPRRSDVRARIASLRGSRQRSALGIPEIIALAAAALLLLSALFSYFYFLRPQRTRLLQLTNERQRLEPELQAASLGVKRNADTQTTVQEILGSLQDFESSHLGASTDRITVYDELNNMILRHKLRISGGLSYTQFEEAAPGATPQPRAPGAGAGGRAKAVQSVFPGTGITLTVEGTYANLRRFIRDVEAEHRHFIVIDAVELEGVTEATPPPLATSVPGEGEAALPQAPPTTTTRGTLVSLRLNMAAYFRRLNAPAVEQQTSQP